MIIDAKFEEQGEIEADFGTVYSGVGGNITVDSALSITSTKPVQNKVVTRKLNEIDTVIEGQSKQITDLGNNKQNKLKAGANITIGNDGTISATGGGTGDTSDFATKEELEAKQDKLVRGENLDDAPTQDSIKPVTSGGVYGYINGIANTLLETKQDKLTAGDNITISEDGTISANIQIGEDGTIDTSNFATKEDLEAKQDKLQFDDVPTGGSTNLVNSNGIFNEFCNFSDAYDLIIDDVIKECKQYTDNMTGGADVSGKLDKITEETQLAQAYIKNADGSQAMVDLCVGLKPESIVIRNTRGAITVDGAQFGTDAVNKKYVDEQIANVSGGTVQKKWELISTITVTPDENGNLPQVIEFSADTDDRPFELTDFFVQMNAGFTDGATSTLRATATTTQGTLVYIASNVTNGFKNTLRKAFIFYYIENGLRHTEISAASDSSSYYDPATSTSWFKTFPVELDNVYNQPIKKINLLTNVGTTKTWIEGSTFTLYGVRK